MRYGKSENRALPEGDFRNLGDLVFPETTALQVVMSQPDSLYLRGFVGESYTGDGWTALDKQELYTSANLFYWLHQNGFYGQTQLASAAALLDGRLTSNDLNTLSVHTVDASRKYVYAPYELCSAEAALLDSENLGDSTLLSRGFRGRDSYTYTALPNQVKRYTELVSFLHLPVQSGSDRVLNLMGRTHTALEYKAIIRKLREARPDIQISSDFIVGFPGETTDDFEKTMKLIADVNFDMSYSFIFSARPGTPAADMVDDVPDADKKQRLYILQERINQQAMAWSRRMLGTVQRILVEGTSRKNIMELSGRTENNRVVNFEGTPDLVGKFVDVEIVDVYTNSLRGKIVRTEAEMGLRIAESPESVIARTRKENDLGVGIYQP